MPPQHVARSVRPSIDAIVGRERLFAWLDDASQHRLVWISAPAGAGKTSLVASWLARRRSTATWLRLQRSDGEPASFFHFLRMAASQVPGLDIGRLPVHSNEYARDCTGFALRFFRRLHAECASESVVVLDNYQELPARSALHRALAAICDEWPAGNLICIGRADPPAAFARMRAARGLAVLDWKDLKLQLDEVRAIVAAQRHELSTEIIARLHEQSGGWAAGLMLMLERLREAGRFDSFTSSAGLQPVFDYFADQVFGNCTESVREMLLRLSYLPRLSADTAERITQRHDADELLADLARRNLFLGRSETTGDSYEFHALFRVFLQHRALRTYGDSGHALRTQEAAELLLSCGLVDEAMQRLLLTRSWSRMREIILAEAPKLVAAGRHETLRGWIEMLPADAVEDAWLTYWLGVACSGRDTRTSSEALERAFARFEAIGDRRGQALALSARTAGWWGERNDFRPLVSVLDRLIEGVGSVGELDRETEVAVFSNLVLAWVMLRPMRDEVHAFARRLRRVEFRDMSAAQALHAGVCLMAYHWMRGDSEELDAVARAVHDIADDPGIAIADRLWFRFWMMTHYVYLADAAGAMDAMDHARTLTEEANTAPRRIDLARWAATVDMQLGRPGRARRRLEEELVPLLASMAPTTAVFVHLELTRCAIEEGRIGEAIEQGRIAAKVAHRCGFVWAQVPARLALCGALCLDGRLTQARAQLARARKLVSARMPMQLASVELYEALLHLADGEHVLARDALQRCFALRAGSRYVWGPGWTRPVVARLAAFAFEHDVCVVQMTRIVHGLRLTPPVPAPQRWPWPVRIRALGTFAVLIDDGAGVHPSGKAAHRLLELLKALVAAGGVDVPAEQLIDTLWPDAAGDAGWSSLHSAVHRLRRLLRHDEAIVLRDNKLSLDRAACWIDSWEFLDRLSAFEKNAADPQAIVLLSAALALYRGHLLASEGAARWVLVPREAMRRRWLRAVNLVGDLHEQRGMWAEAAEVFRDAVLVDPGDEGLCRRWMSSLANAGEAGEALAGYARWERLAHSRGVPPGGAIRRLRDALADRAGNFQRQYAGFP